MKTSSLLLGVGLLLSAIACQAPQPDHVFEPDYSGTPEWSKNAIWYQIFVERFRNGDPNNDPTVDDIRFAYPDSIPADWQMTPWNWDWYKPDPYFAHTDASQNHFGSKSQLRRYGGDLQGVLDQMDYLAELGITAVYFNPLNDGPSLHKYDPRQYRHIDRNFGPNPEEDKKISASEDPANPDTWKWTHADQLFLEVVNELHKRGIKVILDYSWNHVGRDFWALQDVREKQDKSAFVDWFQIKQFDDPTTPEDEFSFEAWMGANTLAVLKKDTVGEYSGLPFEGNISSESLKAFIYAVSARWLDPNGDGNPADGIDGFRLDVAAEVPLGFWREYRKVVKSINPDAYLVGEVWWDEWPDKLMDPRPFLKGDIFDAIMNYRWYRKTRGYLSKGGPVLTASQYVSEIGKINEGIHPQYTYAMMNVAASHDSPRLATSLANKNKYKYRGNPREDAEYIIHKPNEDTRRIQRMLLLQQFSYPGAPHIWNGDELGMWGSDDPNCRKPIIWPDLEFEDEVYHVLPDKKRPRDQVKADADLHAYYQSLIKLRKNHPGLSLGTFEFIYADDETDCVAYVRSYEQAEYLAVFNPTKQIQKLEIPLKNAGSYQNMLNEGESFTSEGTRLLLQIGPQQGLLLQKNGS